MLKEFLEGVHLTRTGVAELEKLIRHKRGPQKYGCHILYYEYDSFIVIRLHKELSELYFLDHRLENMEVQTSWRPLKWLLMQLPSKARKSKMVKYEKTKELLKLEKKIDQYIERHETFKKTFKQTFNNFMAIGNKFNIDKDPCSADFDADVIFAENVNFCNRCKDLLNVISHNINGLLKFLEKHENCWEDFYSKFAVVQLQEIQLCGAPTSDGLSEMDIETLNLKEDDKARLKKFIDSAKKTHSVYWSLSATSRHRGVATFVKKGCAPLKVSGTVPRGNAKDKVPDKVPERARFIMVEFEKIVFVNLYVHNVDRKESLMASEVSDRSLMLREIFEFVEAQDKDVVLAGDMNARICTPFREADDHKIRRHTQQELHALLARMPDSKKLYDPHYAFLVHQGYCDTPKGCSHPTITRCNNAGEITTCCRLDNVLCSVEVMKRVLAIKIYPHRGDNSDHSRIAAWFGCSCYCNYYGRDILGAMQVDDEEEEQDEPVDDDEAEDFRPSKKLKK